MSFSKTLLMAFFVLSLMGLSACHKNEDTVIEFDKSYPLALAPDVEWCVVTEPYVAYKKDSDWSSSVTGHCRKGEILQIIGKRQDSTGERWYCTEKGWLSEISIKVYNNRYKAQKVSDDLLKK